MCKFKVNIVLVITDKKQNTFLLKKKEISHRKRKRTYDETTVSCVAEALFATIITTHLMKVVHDMSKFHDYEVAKRCFI